MNYWLELFCWYTKTKCIINAFKMFISKVQVNADIVATHGNSLRAHNRFNHVAEAKGLKVCSYVEKCAEFKNQIQIQIDWYTKVLCATEYPRGRQNLKIALKWGYPCWFII